ncbi:hypothetical protein F4679DRAFT_584967 [Xylaria curta]|nr:hypothetical protein F4679DRAFT_584967 [Xylaria curta]
MSRRLIDPGTENDHKLHGTIFETCLETCHPDSLLHLSLRVLPKYSDGKVLPSTPSSTDLDRFSCRESRQEECLLFAYMQMRYRIWRKHSRDDDDNRVWRVPFILPVKLGKARSCAPLDAKSKILQSAVRIAHEALLFSAGRKVHIAVVVFDRLWNIWQCTIEIPSHPQTLVPELSWYDNEYLLHGGIHAEQHRILAKFRGDDDVEFVQLSFKDSLFVTSLPGDFIRSLGITGTQGLAEAIREAIKRDDDDGTVSGPEEGIKSLLP